MFPLSLTCFFGLTYPVFVALSPRLRLPKLHFFWEYNSALIKKIVILIHMYFNVFDKVLKVIKTHSVLSFWLCFWMMIQLLMLLNM